MAKLTSPERLSADIEQILTEYKDGTITGINTAIKKLANKGRNAVRRNARATFKGKKYASGWMYYQERWTNRYIAGAWIYEKKQPGLAHLLENGHAKVGGGRTQPRPHVKPVGDQIEREIIGEIERNI